MAAGNDRLGVAKAMGARPGRRAGRASRPDAGPDNETVRTRAAVENLRSILKTGA